MTRKLNPPVPLDMRCTADGAPLRFWFRGKYRRVTAIHDTWTQRALWWEEEADQTTVLTADRAYVRVVCDSALMYELFQVQGRWWLERIVLA